jgi:hypothetical protein
MPQGILISRDDDSKKYKVTFQLPAYDYLALREYPAESVVLTIVPEEKGDVPDGDYVLIQEGGGFLLPVLKLAKNWMISA